MASLAFRLNPTHVLVNEHPHPTPLMQECIILLTRASNLGLVKIMDHDNNMQMMERHHCFCQCNAGSDPVLCV